jgi:hypothetical protein
MYVSSVTQIISDHTLIKKTKELYTIVTHTNLRITSVCIDISKQPINPWSPIHDGSYKFNMQFFKLLFNSI